MTMYALVTTALKRGADVWRESVLEKETTKLRSSGLLPEQDFIDVLCRERRRSERSGRPFLLMLLDGGTLFRGDAADSEWRQLATMLGSSRSTDVVGWYKDHEVMAVLFTEVSDPPAGAVGVLHRKIATSIRQQLTVEQASRIRISFYIFPEAPDNQSTDAVELTLYPDLERRNQSQKIVRGLKRALDVLGSSTALLVLSPLLLLVAMAVKLTSKGPALFRQVRIGQYGQKFVFLKFRSMFAGNDANLHRAYVKKFIAGTSDLAGADAKEKCVFKLKNDPRVTPVGHFLRKTSLDELPQFVNVLKGNMSLVGPRPALPYEVEGYQTWHRRRILEAKPGITGLWQVTGRSRLTFDEMVRLDLKYIREASLKLDVQILLRTPFAVLSGDGAL